MGKPFSFETFLYILENDSIFSINETLFYFDDEPEDNQCHYLGCLRNYDKPYWIGYCDIPNGCEFSTATEMLNSKVFGGKSIKDRWKHLIFEEIGGIGLNDWLVLYGDNYEKLTACKLK